MNTFSQKTVGFLRAAGVFALFALITYAGDVSHLAFLSPTMAALISSVALWAEHYVSPPGTALMGSVRVS